MKKLNRALVRDALVEFLLKAKRPEAIVTKLNAAFAGAYLIAYKAGAADFAEHLQEMFPEEKNIHLSKDGEVQNLYRFHYRAGVLETSKEKWMSPEKASAYAKKNGYRLELIRTTHKEV